AHPSQNKSEMISMMMLSHTAKSDVGICRIANWLFGFVFSLAVFSDCDGRLQSSMQGVPNAMQGFSQNRDQPIQIEAAQLEMRDKKKEATFFGNVKVVQG